MSSRRSSGARIAGVLAWLAPVDERRKLRVLQLALALCVAFATTNIVYTSYIQSQTYDENWHLDYSKKLLSTGDTSRKGVENSKTPITVLNALGEKASALFGYEAEDMRSGHWRPQTVNLCSRLPNLIWFGALVALGFFCARRLAGRFAGYSAALAISLDPNHMAHATVVTVDLAAAATTLMALYAMGNYLGQPRLRHALLAGGAIGLLLIAKVTGALVLVIGLVLFPCGVRWTGKSFAAWRRPRELLRGPAVKQVLRRTARGAGLIVLAGALAVLAVCAAYRFNRVGLSFNEIEGKSKFIKTARRVAPDLPLPLPADYIRMFDMLYKGAHGAETRPRSVAGKVRRDPVWYYFPFLWLTKTPVLLLLAGVFGIGLAAWRRVLVSDALARYLTACFLALLGYFLFVFTNQKGYRFALMCPALFYVLSASGWASLAKARAFVPAVLVVAALTLAEGAFYFGNPLSFTNAAVRPKTTVFRLMSDSNVDWNQNRHLVGAWMEARGIPKTRLNPPHILPGKNLFQLNVLVGKLHAKPFQHDPYAWLRSRRDPDSHFRHTFLYFEVTDALFQEFLDEAHTLSEHAEGRRICERAAYVRLPSGAPRELKSGSKHVCVRAVSKSDIRLVNLAGSAREWHGYRWRTRLGHVTENGKCRLYPAEAAQEVWYRLEPGVHALCVETAWAEVQTISGEIGLAEGRLRSSSERPRRR